MSTVLTIIGVICAVITVTIKFIETKRAHRKILVKLLKRVTGYTLLICALALSMYVAYEGLAYILRFVAKPDAPSRIEIVMLILNFINLAFYSMTTVALGTLIVTSLRKPKPDADPEVTTTAEAVGSPID